MSTLIVGSLGGTLMGLIFVAHLALVLVFRPPRTLARRASEGTVTGIAMFGSVAALMLWTLLGAGAAFLFRAIESNYPTSIPSVPSALYTGLVAWAAVLTAVPAAVLMRDRLWHLLAEYALFIGIFGWLVPLLVKAV